MSQLALLTDRPLATSVRSRRALRGLIAFDSEEAAEMFLERNGRYWTHLANGKVTMTLRPRKVGEEWLLCSWWSGHPWCLDQRRGLRKMRAGDVR